MRLLRVSHRIGVLMLGVVAALGVAAAPSSAAGGQPNVSRTVDLIPSLPGPQLQGFVTGGRKAFYTASWTNLSNATLTNVVVEVTLPSGSSLLAADPAMCTSPPAGTEPFTISCPRDNLGSGQTITQGIFFRAPVVAADTQATVTSQLRGDERANDIERRHTDTFPTDPAPLTIVPTASDSAGGCTQTGDQALATQSGLSATNPIITAARLTGSTGLFCTPVILREQHRSSPTQFCAAGATCTTDLATTFAPAVGSPIQLTFTFISNDRSLTWYKTSDDGTSTTPVADCPGATQLPTGLTACVNSRSKVGSMAVALGVLWAGGPDPTWTG